MTGKNISVKTTGNKTVDFGDAMRTINNLEKKSPLEAVVITYEQRDDVKEPKSVVRIDLTEGKDVLLGKNIDTFKERIKELDMMLKTRQPSYKKYAKNLQNDMKKDGSYMTLRPKVANPTKNRFGRLQISLSNIDKLIKEHPEMVLENNGCDIYDNNCLSILKSKRNINSKATR